MLRLFIQLLPDFQVCLIRQAPVWARAAPFPRPSSTPTHAQAEAAATACAPGTAASQMNGIQDESHSLERSRGGTSSPSAKSVPNGSADSGHDRTGADEEFAGEATSADSGRRDSGDRENPEPAAEGGRSSGDQIPAPSGGTGEGPALGSDALCGTDGSGATPGRVGAAWEAADGGGEDSTPRRSRADEDSDMGAGSKPAPSTHGTEEERDRQDESNHVSGSPAGVAVGSPGDRARDGDPSSGGRERDVAVTNGGSPTAGDEQAGLRSGGSRSVTDATDGESTQANVVHAGDQPVQNVDEQGASQAFPCSGTHLLMKPLWRGTEDSRRRRLLRKELGTGRKGAR